MHGQQKPPRRWTDGPFAPEWWFLWIPAATVLILLATKGYTVPLAAGGGLFVSWLVHRYVV